MNCADLFSPGKYSQGLAQRGVDRAPVVVHNVAALVHVLDPLWIPVHHAASGDVSPLHARGPHPQLVALGRCPLPLERLRLVAVALVAMAVTAAAVTAAAVRAAAVAVVVVVSLW